MAKITVALDWTPNTNHAGLFLAAHAGLYKEAGLDVVLSSPDAPAEGVDSGLTPARQVAEKQATFAIAPSESAVSFATTDPSKPRLVAVAALLQGSTSAIATLKSSGIDSPAKLEGKRYASYGGRFEDAIVSKMVSNAGGDGSKVDFHALDFHAYTDEAAMTAGSVVASYLAADKSDSTWIFSHWEGLLASRANEELHEFALEDYNIPYGYSPVMLAHPDSLVGECADEASTRAFLKATAEGYRRAAEDPSAAAAALCATGHSSLNDQAFVEASAKSIADKFLAANGKWGLMERERWINFVDFLADAGILVDRDAQAIDRAAVDVDALFTNAHLD